MFKISLFENAIDELKATHMYVESFLDWRNDDLVPDIEKLFAIKQMIKHLSSSWELLMKYRIQKHDYSKVFEEPSKITDEKLKTGDFHTIRYKTAIKILNSYGINNSFTRLKELHTYRNQIEHYQIEVSLGELIQTSVEAIDELIAFCSSYITPIIDDRETMYQTGDVLLQLFDVKKELENLLLSGI